MDRPGVRQVPDGSGEQGKMEKTGCKIICDAPTTLAVKGLMMMMMMMMVSSQNARSNALDEFSFSPVTNFDRQWSCRLLTITATHCGVQSMLERLLGDTGNTRFILKR